MNNAGITRDVLLLRMKRADWDDSAGDQPYRGLSAAGSKSQPHAEGALGTHHQRQRVVGETGQAGQANYAASKAGLIGFTKAWRGNSPPVASPPTPLLRDTSRRHDLHAH